MFEELRVCALGCLVGTGHFLFDGYLQDFRFRLRVQDSEFGVQGLGCGVQGSGIRDKVLCCPPWVAHTFPRA